MEHINYNDLSRALQFTKPESIKSSIENKEGVYRKLTANINGFDLTLEYIDFGKYQSKLRFDAIKNGTKYSFNSIGDMQRLLDFKLDFPEIYKTTKDKKKVKTNKKLKKAV
jgi:hypothetical protein